MDFWIFVVDFLIFFKDFFRFLDFFGFFLNFFKIFFGFFWFTGIPFKVTKVTTTSYQGYYWTPKNGQKSIISSIFDQRAKKASAKGQSPPQELEVGPCSGPYLLVSFEIKNALPCVTHSIL